jgi:arsenite-transporting ATPase
MKHVFPVQRSLLKAVRPIANRFAPIELPPDSYFGNIQQLFSRLEGIDEILEDPVITSARLVTNPEQMVLRETQRAFVYFSVHGLTVDTVIANRVLPETVHDTFFEPWREAQTKTLAQMEAYFAPVPVRRVPLFSNEVMGSARLQELADRLYAPGEDPSIALRSERPYSFHKVSENQWQVRLQLPFAVKGEVSLFKKGDELVVEVGTLRRHIGLPASMAALSPARAKLDNKMLIVELQEVVQ